MPSPLAHFTSGLLIAAFPAIMHKSHNWKYYTMGTIAAAAPDLDMLLVYIGIDYFDAHRTFSHSFMFALGIMCLLGLLNIFINSRPENKLQIPYVLIGVCLLSHVLLDLLGVDKRGPQGLMLFWPFTHEFYYPAINLFPSPVDGNGNILSIRALTQIAYREVILICMTGLTILSTTQAIMFLKTKISTCQPYKGSEQ
jgi:membrane-bound metal-dependent hydrolase YbcI (DUF457 family)